MCTRKTSTFIIIKKDVSFEYMIRTNIRFLLVVNTSREPSTSHKKRFPKIEIIMKFNVVALTSLMAFGSEAFTVQQSNARTSTSLNLYGEPRKVEIIPSVLPADWANMGGECKRLEDAGVDRIQFDVMDGNFVPNLTFGPELIAACRKYTKVPFETQLMVSQYNCETMLDQYTEATKGPDGEPGVVIVHVEANTHLHRTLSKIREAGGSPSVALNPHTPAGKQQRNLMVSSFYQNL